METKKQVIIKTFKARPDGWCSLGNMDYLMGKTITLITGDGIHFYTEDREWEFTKDDFNEIIHESPDEKQVGGSHYTDLPLEPKPERNKPIIDEIEIDTPKHKE